MPANTKVSMKRYEKYREQKSISDDMAYFFSKKIVDELYLFGEISTDEHKKILEKFKEIFNSFISLLE